MTIKRSDLSWITVSDIKRAKKFFTEVIGLEVRTDTPEFGWVEIEAKEGGSSIGYWPI